MKTTYSHDCNTKESDELFTGWINIYDSGGFIQSGSGIYETEDKALEAGKIIKGYITSVSISFPSTLIKTIGKS